MAHDQTHMEDRSLTGREPCRHLAASGGRCIEANPLAGQLIASRIRDKSPASTPVDIPAGPAEAGFAGKHDGLITVFDANFVEDPRDVIANRFLRKLQ